MKKKRKKSNPFTMENVQRRCSENQAKIASVKNHFHALRDTCLSDFLYVGLDEEEALVLLATKLTTNGVVALRNAVCFVPNNIVSQPRGCAVGLRTALIHQVLSRSQPLPFATMAEKDLDSYLTFFERHCRQFIDSNSLNKEHIFSAFQKASDGLLASMFLSPPVNSCLSCDGGLTMHNSPSSARLYGMSGPVAVSKVTLECKHCDIKYGITKYTSKDGSRYYPKHVADNITVVEVTNCTYMHVDLYMWIPSLRYDFLCNFIFLFNT